MIPVRWKMRLVDELISIIDRYGSASEKERRIIRMAISLLDQLDNSTGTKTPIVEFSSEELHKLPGRWELVNGQLA